MSDHAAGSLDINRERPGLILARSTTPPISRSTLAGAHRWCTYPCLKMAPGTLAVCQCASEFFVYAIVVNPGIRNSMVYCRQIIPQANIMPGLFENAKCQMPILPLLYVLSVNPVFKWISPGLSTYFMDFADDTDRNMAMIYCSNVWMGRSSTT